MIIKLISPKNKQHLQEPNKWEKMFQNVMFGFKKYGAISTTLPTIAGLTPSRHTVIIQDENVEDIDFAEPVDLVGISSYTATIERAYEIADAFKSQNVYVVLGGVHVSSFPEEAEKHADAIVIGEGELVWSQIIEDVKKKKLKKRYTAEKYANFRISPMPRYDLIKHERYYHHHIQTARGCVFRCDYCSAHTLFGDKIRYKSIKQVIKEVKKALYYDRKSIHFCDDVFVLDRRRVLALTEALKPLRIRYTIQGTVGMHEDHEMLRALAESGCTTVLIGFESINQNNLIDCGKGKAYVVNEYYKVVRDIQKYGMMVGGFFIFGFDHDTIETFEETVQFVRSSGMGLCSFGILTPLPHTKLYARMKEENRLLYKPWSDYDLHHVVFRPKRMSADELYNGYMWAMQNCFELEVLFDRIMNLYNVWNECARLQCDRMGVLIGNLSAHYVASHLPSAMHPKQYRASKK